jgi:iron-sulfur cluster repair protein YtfE (RIC family)
VSTQTDEGPLAVQPTTAPVHRLSDREVWDESTRPVGPPPPDGQAYGPLGQQIGQHLVDVHDHLRHELEQVRGLIDQVRSGAARAAEARSEINAMALRQNDWTLGAYCASYCRILTEHHALEDAAVFPHLRDRDAALGPVIDQLEAEHRVIHTVLEDLDRALVDYIRAPGEFTELQVALDVLTDALLSHLAYEEQQLVEPLARYGFFADQI